MLNTIKGKVTSNKGLSQKGRFKAIFKIIGEDPVEVIYTSPMYRVNGGGLLALPTKGDIILAAHDPDTTEVYYHSTIVDTQLPKTQGKGVGGPGGDGGDGRVPNFVEIPDSKFFADDGSPVKVKYQNQVGAGLDIIRNFKPAPGKPISSVNLISEAGKKVGLDDSPGVEAVVVQNQHGDGIIVKGDADDLFPSRCIQVASKGHQSFIVAESSLDLTVVEGLDISIENRSTGAMAQTPSEQYWPNGNLPCKRWGGIYLRSESGDISIAANADTGEPEQDGRIFIVTPKARIQITETGAIQIDSDQDDIRIKSTSNINMEGANINIKATGSLKMESVSGTSILSGGNVDVDGAEIHLKPTTPPASIPPLTEHSTLDLNDYSE